MHYVFKKICVISCALMVFVALSAADKDSSTNVTTGLGVLGCVAVAAVVKNVYAKNEQLTQENKDLRIQNAALGIVLAVSEQGDGKSLLQRERDRLKQENDSLEKQNRILAEYCPLLKEAALQEFSGGCNPDIAAAWGVD